MSSLLPIPGSLAEAFPEPLAQEMITAAGTGNTAAVRELIGKGANPDAMGPSKATPLLWFMAHNDLKGFATMLAAGANPNLQFPDDDLLPFAIWAGHTMVTLAARHENPKFLELVLAAKGDPNAVTSKGKPALLFALDTAARLPPGPKKTTHVQLLIDARASIDKPDAGGITGLFNVTLTNQFDLVNFLLDHGASVSLHGDHGERLAEEIRGTSISPKFPLRIAERDKALTRVERAKRKTAP